MKERRSTYFIFQGLLTVVLLLFFLYQRPLADGSLWRLALVATILGGLLVFVGIAPLAWLSQARVQGALFVTDVIMSSLVLEWAQRPNSDLYLTYFLVIFGTAMTQNMVQSFLVALVATFLYGHLALQSSGDFSLRPEFWLRIPYLWIVAAFTAMLSRDTRAERQMVEDQHRERLFHMERLAALGQISAEVAHRIKAPLTTIRVNAEVMGHRRGVSAAMRKELQEIEQEVEHCKEILEKLLNLGRIEEIDIHSVDLRDAIKSAIGTIEPQATHHGVRLAVVGLETPAPIEGDRVLLREAIVSVLQNAVEAMPDGGDLSVGLHWIRRGGWWPLGRQRSDAFEVRIADTGMGIETKNIETIFRPFYTTKPRRGHGLGLSAALRILDKHGGSIHATSDGPGAGACFTLTIPANRHAA